MYYTLSMERQTTMSNISREKLIEDYWENDNIQEEFEEYLYIYINLGELPLFGTRDYDGDLSGYIDYFEDFLEVKGIL